jgi:hypothetical protein
MKMSSPTLYGVEHMHEKYLWEDTEWYRRLSQENPVLVET